MFEDGTNLAIAGASWTIGLCVLFSCLTDLRYRIVCNEVSLIVLGAALVIFSSRDLPSTFAWMAYGAVALAVLAAAMAGTMGGGDTKLIFALLPSLTGLGCLQFIVVTTIAGGLLGLCVLVASRVLERHAPRRVATPRRRNDGFDKWLRHETARLRRGRSIPYVPAIALGWLAAAHAQ